MRGSNKDVCISLDVFDAWVELRLPDASLSNRVLEYFPPGVRVHEKNCTGEAPVIALQALDGRWRVDGPGTHACEHDGLDEALQDLMRRCTLAVARKTREIAVVHAGAVALRGEAILLPGRSFSGKSSLVAALLRSGAGYLSDNCAIVDRKAHVRPFPRDLALRGAGGATKTTCRPEELGSVVETASLPVALILFTHYAQGAVWEPQRLTRGEALAALMANTLAAGPLSPAAVHVLAHLSGAAAALRSARAEATDVAPAIIEIAHALRMSREQADRRNT